MKEDLTTIPFVGDDGFGRYIILNTYCIIMCTVKFLNFRTPENVAVIYLKFKQKAQTLGYSVKKM